MKWIGITGTWKIINKQVENDVRSAVKEIFMCGNGIVTGGALGVDYIATDEAIKRNPTADKIKVFLPTTLLIYAKHYFKRSLENVITRKQADQLIHQLETLRKINPEAVIENHINQIVDKTTYFERNSFIVNASDEIYAFHVNESGGVQDTIDKAKAKKIPVKLFTYKIAQE